MAINAMDDGREEVEWCMAGTTNSFYVLYPGFSYLSSNTATDWNNNYLNIGGFKYSQLRIECMLAGQEVYSQCTSIKADDSTLENGIKFSELKYTDNDKTSAIYEYDYQTDTFSVVSEYSYGSKSNWFIKGYFMSVGRLEESTFNSGNYYTFNSSKYLYTTATTYDSSTTYYGFFEALQKDGTFVSALNSISQYLKKWQDKASTGKSGNYTYLSSFSDYVHIPCVEEITGLNRDSYLINGSSARNAYMYNIANEGTKKAGFNSFSKQAIGNYYWTRSSSSYNGYSFCCFTGSGYVDYSAVTGSIRVRVCFQTL